MAEYCTEDNFEISPGVFTHTLTKAQVEQQYGCCQKYVCGIACPAAFDTKGIAVQFGIPVAVVSLSWFLMALIIARLTIKGDARNFFVCNRSLPMYVVVCALLAQGLDSNATLGMACSSRTCCFVGNVVNSYKFAFWDGAVLPLGLGISLVLNGLLLAAPINRMRLLTLPELFGRKYGGLMEVIVSCIEITSFTFLLAGNLVGISLVLQFCFGLPKGGSIAIAGTVLGIYSASGGLFSVALTDLPQVIGGFTAFTATVIYMMTHESGPQAAPPSLGFALDLGNITATTPGYSGPLNCSDPVTGASTCDNYAYPQGDKLVYDNGMTDPNAYAPFPNAILINWATIFVLGLGNLCALDFQARCMASKTPNVARTSCFISGILLVCIGVPFGLLSGLARKHYGPDSQYAEFAADTCSAPLGLSSCAEWLPVGQDVLFRLLWQHAPKALGAWTMVAIVTASMSTADGAILATSTVMAHNIWRKVPKYGTSEANLLWVARIFHVPMTVMSCCVAAWAYNPAYLLVVAFDIVFAGVLVPLLAAVYYPRASPNAGLLACVSGSLVRLVLEFTLPKDGSLVAFGQYALQYGSALAGLPAFMQIDPPDQQDFAGVWDPDSLTCDQPPLSDWTGLDSLISPVVSLLVFVAVSLFERFWPGLDILFFIPKAWRATQPLYRDDDMEVDPDSSRTPALAVEKAKAGISNPGGGSSGFPSAPRHLKDDSSAHGGGTFCADGGASSAAVSPLADDPISREVQLAPGLLLRERQGRLEDGI
ncbi:hypothetical protein VOLCADRAFT_94586 [Volvox carteri f. nagariensis]|uniref:Uncharacterized protein n=1 Tax=Volvox carteri f. nagariensis TaxID=3068 RepID=D8U566_VOLCA|nr:uncharacterized protein VOLCADRAFT_94586 [Volvox carteri f. nagariensis]EFJ45094.1 hypothetical protein VOLCADRAFT_94586 [Volvox carteri f. nagariensis]|eukprot:XP_002953770.1 hypothetical protein VOLCADRAFT_94586 [Volvox carteri f. nagariensis]